MEISENRRVQKTGMFDIVVDFGRQRTKSTTISNIRPLETYSRFSAPELPTSSRTPRPHHKRGGAPLPLNDRPPSTPQGLVVASLFDAFVNLSRQRLKFQKTGEFRKLECSILSSISAVNERNRRQCRTSGLSKRSQASQPRSSPPPPEPSVHTTRGARLPAPSTTAHRPHHKGGWWPQC